MPAGWAICPFGSCRTCPYNTPETPHAPPSTRRDLLFVGTEGFEPNRDAVQWFLQNCWPQIRAKHPESRFRLVGSGNWARFAEVLSRSEHGEGSEGGKWLDGVDIVGQVDDLAEEYDRARLVVAPIFVGGGSKIKVIEACAHGRPAVVTSHSSRGFGAEIEALLPQSDTPDGYTAACLHLLDDDAAIDDLASRLRDLQQASYSRSAVENQIEAQIREVAAR